jgi:Na+-driven multidrug efflux pump
LADTSTRSDAVRAKVVRHLINTSLLFGGGIAAALSLTTYFQKASVLRGLTNNPAVQSAAAAIFPAVLLTQVFKGLAYPVNGIIMGGMDWVFSMVGMWVANITCVGMIRGWSRGAQTVSLNQIWIALAAFMGIQVVTGIMRYESKTGVWRLLRKEKEFKSV